MRAAVCQCLLACRRHFIKSSPPPSPARSSVVEYIPATASHTHKSVFRQLQEKNKGVHSKAFKNDKATAEPFALRLF